MNLLVKTFRLANFFRYRIRNKIQSNGLGLVSSSARIYNKGLIYVGTKFIVSDAAEIRSYGSLKIGYNFCLNKHSRIIAHGAINIGNNVTIAQFVSILDHDHKYTMESENLKLDGYSVDPITIGNNVWIADKVTILKGVSIGDNVVIGANSLVNKSIPSNSIAVGNPCKVVKSLI